MTTAIVDNAADIARRMKELDAEKRGGNLGLLADLKPLEPYVPVPMTFRPGDLCPQCQNGQLFGYPANGGKQLQLECTLCNWKHLNP